jgi:hypothetical protein
MLESECIKDKYMDVLTPTLSLPSSCYRDFVSSTLGPLSPSYVILRGNCLRENVSCEAGVVNPLGSGQ